MVRCTALDYSHRCPGVVHSGMVIIIIMWCGGGRTHGPGHVFSASLRLGHIEPSAQREAEEQNRKYCWRLIH
jgi:hypothetical protein